MTPLIMPPVYPLRGQVLALGVAVGLVIATAAVLAIGGVWG